MGILKKNCLVCGHLFLKPYEESLKSWRVRHKYCSRVCLNKSPRSKSTRLKMRLAKLGRPSWNKGKRLTEAHKAALRKKKPMSQEGRQAHRDSYRNGSRRPWNKIGDGITPLNERIRKSPEYKEWRRKVFERDDYTCKECGKRGGNLHADHIKPFALCPGLRFNVTNGRTLCVPCHRNTETYGRDKGIYGTGFLGGTPKQLAEDGHERPV